MRECPVCGNPGQKVPRQTVLSMVKDSTPSDSRYWLCQTASCQVAYYGNNIEVWRQDQIRVPIAFKDGAKPKYVCYCSGVTEQDVINVVLSKQAVTLAEAITVTGAMNNGNCIKNNPAGICCSTTFKEAFYKALELRRQ